MYGMYLYILQLPYYRHKQTVFEVHPTEVQFTVHNSSVSIEVNCMYTNMLYINHGKEVYMANILPETEVRGSLQ